MNTSSSALIIGCGYVGSKLKNLLKSKGWIVQGLRRSPSKDTNDIALDVGSEFTLHKDYDVVFYMVSAGGYTPENYENAYIRGVKNTLQAIHKRKNLPRIVYVSSTGLFSENSGGIVTEKSPIERSPFSKKALAHGEDLITESGLNYSIIRFSGIYGPERFRLVEQLKKGNAHLKECLSISNRIHLDDCAGILHHVVTTKNPHSLYIGSDNSPAPYNHVIKWLARQMKIEEPKMETQSRPSSHRSNKKCSNQLLLDTGYIFKFPSFREGFRSCL